MTACLEYGDSVILSFVPSTPKTRPISSMSGGSEGSGSSSMSCRSSSYWPQTYPGSCSEVCAIRPVICEFVLFWVIVVCVSKRRDAPRESARTSRVLEGSTRQRDFGSTCCAQTTYLSETSAQKHMLPFYKTAQGRRLIACAWHLGMLEALSVFLVLMQGVLYPPERSLTVSWPPHFILLRAMGAPARR